RKLCEELGDLLLQVIFHAQIASEENRFTIDDVAGQMVLKLKRRHPHVFGEVKVDTPEQVLENWEEIKMKEGKQSILEGVPPSLPSLLRARRVQEKAKRVGFDWEDTQGAYDKVVEEIGELKKAVDNNNREKIEEEFGDVLFSLVNVSRFLDVDAENALRKTINKFIHRFQSLEKTAKHKNNRKPLKDYTLKELDELWEDTKND
ncbi:MAG: nucleoside triphosphate pyrophosphohydrolase, partial [Spirochaetota bacterium]